MSDALRVLFSSAIILTMRPIPALFLVGLLAGCAGNREAASERWKPDAHAFYGTVMEIDAKAEDYLTYASNPVSNTGVFLKRTRHGRIIWTAMARPLSILATDYFTQNVHVQVSRNVIDVRVDANLRD